MRMTGRIMWKMSRTEKRRRTTTTIYIEAKLALARRSSQIAIAYDTISSVRYLALTIQFLYIINLELRLLVPQSYLFFSTTPFSSTNPSTIPPKPLSPPTQTLSLHPPPLPHSPCLSTHYETLHPLFLLLFPFSSIPSNGRAPKRKHSYRSGLYHGCRCDTLPPARRLPPSGDNAV